MGKTSRKTKAKKKDFNKVKLKVGKKKPQATNFTETSFKSQSIYIADQLKSNNNKGEILTHRKQNITELLAHLTHHSPTFRYKALNGLKEIVQIQKLNENFLDLAEIIRRASKLIEEQDSEVRKACIALLQLIFTQIPENKMFHHFPQVLAHLYCAMCNISSEVQKDSLKIVDKCLEKYPKLTRSQGGTKMLQYFIELISTTEEAIGSKSGRRVITMKSFKNASAVNWRMEVLSRLQGLLSIMSSAKRSYAKPRRAPVEYCSDSKKQQIVTVLPPPCEPYFTQHWTCHRGVWQPSNFSDDDNELMEELTTTIIPLVMQCWIDASSARDMSNNSDIIATMVHVATIALLVCTEVLEKSLVKSTRLSLLRKTYMKTFNKHFFDDFPFEEEENLESSAKRKRRGKKLSKRGKVDVTLLNLVLCNLMTLLTNDETLHEDQENISTIATWLSNYLQRSSATTQPPMENQNFYYVLPCLSKLLHSNIKSELSSKLLLSLYRYFDRLPLHHTQRPEILMMLMKLFDKCCEEEGFQKFLLSMPSLLLSILKKPGTQACTGCRNEPRPESLQCLFDFTVDAIRRKEKNFLSAWNSNCPKLTQLLETEAHNIFCSSEIECVHCSSLQRELVTRTISYLPTLSAEDYLSWSRVCFHPHIAPGVARNIFQQLIHRLDLRLRRLSCWDNCSEEATADDKLLLLKFLWMLFLGVGNLEELSINNLASLPKFELQRHLSISKRVCDQLSIFATETSETRQALMIFIKSKIVNDGRPSNIKVIVGLVNLGKVFCTSSTTSLEEYELFGRVASLCLTICFGSERECSNCDVIMKVCVELLHSSSEIIKHCVKSLISNSNALENVLALTELLRIPKFHEIFLDLSSDVTYYINRIEKCELNCLEEVQKLKTVASTLRII